MLYEEPIMADHIEMDLVTTNVDTILPDKTSDIVDVLKME